MNADGVLPRISLHYAGTNAGVLALLARDLGLTILTLGIYAFWARTRLRAYVLGRTAMAGDPFLYLGRGRDLLIGALVGSAVIALPVTATNFAVDALAPGHAVPGTVGLLAILLFLAGIVEFRAWRYRLGRTEWRGVRFGMVGSGLSYAAVVFGHRILAILTLGLSIPLMDVARANRLARSAVFGDRPVHLEVEAGPLYKKYLLAWLLFPVTLGFSMAVYRAAKFRYFARAFQFEGLRLRFNTTGADVFLFDLINRATIIGVILITGLMVVPPLLFAYIWVGPTLLVLPAETVWIANAIVILLGVLLSRAVLTIRQIGFFFTHFGLNGQIDFDTIVAEYARNASLGPGSVIALDAY